MKIIVLLLALLIGFGATVKRSAKEMKEMSHRMELNQFKNQPNLLPQVEITAQRS